MKYILLLVVLALLVGVGPASAQSTGPWRTYLPLVGRHCVDLGDSPISQYEVPDPGLRVQVLPNDACSRVEMRIFYRSVEFPNGLWTYWVRADLSSFIFVDRNQDVGGGIIRHNELVEFRDLTGHGYTITQLPY